MRGRKYLRRLTFVILFGLLIPVLIAFLFFRSSVLRNREQLTEESYTRAFTTYTSMFDRKMQELEQYAFRISVESERQGSLFRNGFGQMTPYRIWELTQALNQSYLRSDVSDWGLYSYRDQRILTGSYSCTLQDFLYKYDEEDDAELAAFFAQENYQLRDTIFATTRTAAMPGDRLFVGVCTRIGSTDDPALVFYVLSPQNVEKSMVMVGDEGVGYYLCGSDGKILLTWGDTPDEAPETVLAQSARKHVGGYVQQVRYDINSKYPSLHISAYIGSEAMQNTIMKLFNSVWLVLIVAVILMLAVCGAAIYISYKPVKELTDKFDYSSGDEFGMFLNEMSANAAKIDEQQLLITDLLMNHLLYGVHISSRQIQQLGVTADYPYYCVMLMDGYSFVNSEMTKRLTDVLMQNCRARVFVTDWYEENCNVLIAFMFQQDSSDLIREAKTWLQTNCTTAGQLYAGPVCDMLENIQQSFNDCIVQRKKANHKTHAASGAEKPKRLKQKEMMRQILTFLEENFRTPDINQAQVADKFQISNYTLSRLFKSEMGVGFTEYLSAKRLDYAKMMLLTTESSVRDIALQSGFTNENYFSRTFKLHTGVVPSAFRKK